jgi:DNA-binding ferritin-like protein (Dps family)
VTNTLASVFSSDINVFDALKAAQKEGEKVTGQDMIQLSRYLRGKRPQEQRDFLGDGLALACQNMEKAMKQRTTEVNTDKVAAFIEKKIQTDNTLLETYNGVTMIAQGFESAPRGHY